MALHAEYPLRGSSRPEEFLEQQQRGAYRKERYACRTRCRRGATSALEREGRVGKIRSTAEEGFCSGFVVDYDATFSVEAASLFCDPRNYMNEVQRHDCDGS